MHQTALASVPVSRESRVVELIYKPKIPGLQVEDEFRVILKLQVNLNSRRLSPKMSNETEDSNNFLNHLLRV